MPAGKKILRFVEFFLLFFGIPLYIFLDKDFKHPSMIVVPLLIFVFTILKRTTDFKWKELIAWDIPVTVLWRNAAVVLGTLMILLGIVVFSDPEHLFDLPRSHPWIFVALCIFYPVFSAFGQEVIYRTFLFRRYKVLFGGDWPTIIASGISFSYLHIVYYDPVSMIITLVGGVYFARLYQQTGSVLFTAVMHGLMGIIIFGVGMGRFFWLDMPG